MSSSPDASLTPRSPDCRPAHQGASRPANAKHEPEPAAPQSVTELTLRAALEQNRRRSCKLQPKQQANNTSSGNAAMRAAAISTLEHLTKTASSLDARNGPIGEVRLERASPEIGRRLMGQLPETEMCWTERGPQNSARKRPKKATTLKNKNAAISQKKSCNMPKK